MSGVVEKIKAKVDNVIHPDHHNTTTTGTHTTSTHTGAHAGHHGTSTNAGPHDSNIANKIDPRVDSDRDGSRNAGAAAYGPGGANTHTGVGAGTHNNTGLTGHHGTSTNAGPHDSNLANKLDPRVDSDRDGSRNAGAAAYGPGGAKTGFTGQHGNTGNTFGQSHTGIGPGTSTNAGPHDSNLANKLDPRVDSDRDGSRNAGAASYGPGGANTGNTFGQGHTGVGAGNTGLGSTHDTGLTGQHHAGNTGYNSGLTSGTNATNAGPHDSNLANKLDPRVDSDRDGSARIGAGTGPASSTAGPHGSNFLNQADPRIDSDLDGSRTVGGNNQSTY